MDTDKAYIFGLIIGGGKFGNAEDFFSIQLPFRQWGSYLKNPQRAAQISDDIMRFVGPLLLSIYGLRVNFSASDKHWTIICEGDLTDLKADLESYGINCEGELRTELPITGIIPHLRDANIKRRFIAGLADSIGSTNPTQRRFSDDVQILSFELKGFNFESVCALCNLLYSVNCIPDQILWNHPNFHASNNPYYKSWAKGFKLRIQLDQYAEFGAFGFKTKVESANKNRAKQTQSHITEVCEEREIRPTISTVHPAENDSRLPECIRGGHYIHFRHICAALGCPHAPYQQLNEAFSHIGELIAPFPILCKDSKENIQKIIENDALMSSVNYEEKALYLKDLVKDFKSNSTSLILGIDDNTGYPVADILQAVAYLIVPSSKLKGTRPKGKFMDIIRSTLTIDPEASVRCLVPNRLTPLVLYKDDRGALIGPKNPHLYSKLIAPDIDNPYKLVVRPIILSDLDEK